MDKSFDRKRCLANVTRLIEEKGLKVGAVESKIGVSTGYISRLNKEDNTTKLSIEFLVSLSEVLEVSLDMLCCYDLAGMTPTELYIFRFNEKVLQETVFGSRTWERDAPVPIESLSRYSGGDTAHPLFRHDGAGVYYYSYFADASGTQVGANIYRTRLDNDNWLYLTKVEYPEGVGVGYELILARQDYEGDWNTNPVCASDTKENSTFTSIMSRLYSIVAESCRKLSLNASARGVIDKYMGTSEFDDVDDGDLPF